VVHQLDGCGVDDTCRDSVHLLRREQRGLTSNVGFRVDHAASTNMMLRPTAEVHAVAAVAACLCEATYAAVNGSSGVVKPMSSCAV
jgi:hypothetical protein